MGVWSVIAKSAYLPNMAIWCKITTISPHYQIIGNKNAKTFAHVRKIYYFCSVLFTWLNPQLSFPEALLRGFGRLSPNRIL